MSEIHEEPTFYDELHAVLEDINARRERADQISFRKAVVYGMSLPDSFTSKIKSGQYKPTLDRIVSMSAYLEVHPSRFPSYARRLAVHEVQTDPRFIKLFQLLACLTPQVYNLFVSGLLKYAEKLLADSRRPLPATTTDAAA